MLLPRDPFIQDQGFHSLLILRESLGFLLGSKENLTPCWAESVRLIIEDISSANNPSKSKAKRAKYEQDKKIIEDELSSLRGEIADLETALKEEDGKRSDALNRYLDIKGNIRVFCRVRPLLASEENAPIGLVVSEGSDSVIITAGKRKKFDLDKIFLPTASQDDVFSEVEPVVRSSLDGHNVCIFSYGQTGTGKTFTMEGKPGAPGIIPRTLWQIFHHAESDKTVNFHLTLSMLEVYMGSLRDLLIPPSRRVTDPVPKSLSIQMDPRGNVEVENLTEFIITDFDQANKLYQVGTLARSVGRTNANETSSRSHCLCRITISRARKKGGEQSVSKLWLVDLGGSERLLKTQATGQTLEEGKAINLSLSALGDVINALRKKESHIPYRNSKLTQILRDSLCEESKLLMMVHVSPKEADVGEGICSLGFASRARGIHLGQELSESSRQERMRMMRDLSQQMAANDCVCQNLRSKIEQLEFLVRKKEEFLELPPVTDDDDDEDGCDDAEAAAEKVEEQNTSEDSQINSQTDSQTATNKDEKASDAPRKVTKNRFMTPTASSRMKRNPNTVVEAVKNMKKVSGKSVFESKKKGAKVVPLDCSTSPPPMTHILTKVVKEDVKQRKPLVSTILSASNRIMGGGGKVKDDVSLKHNHHPLMKETLVDGKSKKKPSTTTNRVSVAVDCNCHLPFIRRL